MRLSLRISPLVVMSFLLILVFTLSGCTPVDLTAEMPVFDTGVDSNAWARVPAGEFLSGQFNEPAPLEYDYEIMVPDVTVAQYTTFLNAALADGTVKLDENQISAFYPGDEFRGVKHEMEISAGDYLLVPLNDPASRFTFDGKTFSAMAGYENHPMTNVSWFGAWAFCGYYDYRLPSELEWEKAARGSEDERPYPWGDELTIQHANFYGSKDPAEDMSSLGSRTTPVGFYNGKMYAGFQTIDAASPYGLYDMAGNVWQWTGDIYEGMHLRIMRGGSKDNYKVDLRIWVKNNAIPTYTSPAVGFRCVKDGG